MKQVEPAPGEGVVIPQSTIDDSSKKKAKHRTPRQTEVYRDMANIKVLIARVMMKSPRRLAKFCDGMLGTVSNAKHSLSFALEYGDGAARCENLSFAKALVEDIEDDAKILQLLGVINKSECREIKSLAQKVVGQCSRLRDYYNSQGINTNVNTLSE